MNIDDKKLIEIDSNPLNVNRYGEYKISYSADKYKIVDDGEKYRIIDQIGYASSIASISDEIVLSTFNLTEKEDIDLFLSSFHYDLYKQNLSVVLIDSTMWFSTQTGQKLAEQTMVDFIIDEILYSENPSVYTESMSSYNEADEPVVTEKITKIDYFKIDPNYNDGKIVQKYLRNYQDVEIKLLGLSSFNAYPENKYIQSIEFGNTVIRIGAEAFRGNETISSLTVPKRISYIGKDAFADTNLILDSIYFEDRTAEEISAMENYPWGLVSKENMTEVTYSDGTVMLFKIKGNLTSSSIPNIKSASAVKLGTFVTSIGNYAFSECSGLTSITIPDSVTNIGSYAFRGCTGLTEITIPKSVTSIGGSTFEQCSSLTSIIIPDSVTSIGNYAFEKCSSLVSITIGNSVTSIGVNAFRGCTGLTEITIPDSVTSIGEYTFYDCSGLTSIMIGNGVTSIGYSAFYGCSSLTSITIPDSVTSIGDYAFSGCTSVSFLSFRALNAPTIGSSTFGSYSDNYIGSRSIEIRKLQIPDNAIGYDSGYWKEKLLGVCGFIIEQDDSDTTKTYAYYSGNSRVVYNISGELKQEDIALTGLILVKLGTKITKIGQKAFYNCSSLSFITIPDSVTSIGNDAFRYCSKLTSITIPDGVTSIGKDAFHYCSSLISITIPDSVTSIGNDAFSSCSGLLSITIPNSVTSIGNYAFYGCSSLTSITIPCSVVSIGHEAFASCSELMSVIVYPNNPVFDSRDNCNAIIRTSTNELIAGCKCTTIPDSVTSIGNYAFQGCSKLTSISIPDSVMSIGNQAFYNCYGLTSITIPDSVTSIGNDAFRYCSKLTSITIPDSVTSIGNDAFRYCSKLTSITIPDSVTSIGNSVFEKCSSLLSITIPNSVTSIGNDAFYYCSSLTSIIIPNSVTSIGNYAFSGCSKLMFITCLATTAPTVKSDTFGYSNSSYTGRNSYLSGNNVLKVPQGATGYTSSYWADPLCNSTKCGFHIERF